MKIDIFFNELANIFSANVNPILHLTTVETTNVLQRKKKMPKPSKKSPDQAEQFS